MVVMPWPAPSVTSCGNDGNGAMLMFFEIAQFSS
jgi:hypothetical protein